MSNKTISINASTGGVLEPISIDEFFAEYWEVKPLHIARTHVNPFAGLISIEAIEGMLSTYDLSYPSVQLSHSGHRIGTEEYTDDNGRIVSSRVIERYHSGSTIVFTQVHKIRNELMELCRRIQTSFMMRCQTNVYLSPAGNQGFNPHFDTHDVFILQVSGKKTFNFYSGGLAFPTNADRFNSKVHSVGEKTQEIELNAGDTLYIPRGVVHDAVANSSTPSLHVTLGVYPVLMHELLQEMIRLNTGTNEALRKAVPQSYWMPLNPSFDTKEVMTSLLSEKLNHELMDAALSSFRDDIALDAVQDCRGMLDPSQVPPEQEPSKITVNHSMIMQTERLGSVLIIRTFGAVLEFNDPIAASIEWLFSRDSASLQDIPDLNASQRSALIKQLTSNNLIKVV